MKRLCIGGPHDGLTIEMPQARRTLSVMVDDHRSEYRVETLAAPQQEFELLVHDTTTLEQALECLIEWYRPPPTPKSDRRTAVWHR